MTVAIGGQHPYSFDGVEFGADSIRIAGAATCAAISRSRALADRVPLLSAVLSTHPVADGRRSPEQFGGLCAEPVRGAGVRAIAMALDADVEVDAGGRLRVLDASAYFGDRNRKYCNAFGVSALVMPHRVEGGGYAVETCAGHGAAEAGGGVAVVIWLDPDQRIDHCAIAAWGTGGWAERDTALELGMIGGRVEDVDANDVGADFIWNLPGCKGSRARRGSEMVAHAWGRAVRDAQHPREAGAAPLVDVRDPGNAI